MNLFSLLINTDHVLQALDIMWKGVVAIFIVIALVIVVTTLVNKACVHFEKKSAEKKAKKDAENNPQG